LVGLMIAAILFYMFRFIFNRIGNRVSSGGEVMGQRGGGGGRGPLNNFDTYW
jgi:hypothetical protein